MGEPARTRLAAAALAAAALAAYASAIAHPILFDGVELVLENAAIRSLARLPEIAGFGPEGFAIEQRWVREASYALEYAVAGPWAPLYHLDNLLLHGAVGLLVLALLRDLTGSPRLALWSTGLFLLHPICVNVVAQVAGRRELLAALFALATLLLLRRWTARRAVWALAAAVVALYLATFSKQIGLLAAPAFLLVDAYRRSAGEAPVERAPLGAVGCAFARLRERPGTYALLAGLALGGVGAILLPEEDGIGLSGSPSYYAGAGHPLDLLDRLRIAGLGLRLLLVPVGLSADYFYDALGLVGPGVGLLGALDLALLAAALAATVWGLLRGHWVGFGGAWYALFYLPHAGIIPWHEVFAERFLYLSAVGFCLALAALGEAAARRLALRPAVALAGGLALLAALGVATQQRTQVWASHASLWQSVKERYPRNARAHHGLGEEAHKAGRPEEAARHYRRALEILPVYLQAQVGAVTALVEAGRLEEAEPLLERARRLAPESAEVWDLQGYLHDARGEPAEARRCYRRAIRLDPTLASAYNNLARHRAMQGELRDALRLYERALEQDPTFVTALRNLAALHRHGFGDAERAAAYERRAEAAARARGLAPPATRPQP